MSAANGRSAERRLRRRRRKLAAATSTVLLAAAAVAGEPISLAASNATQVAGGVGGGLNGMTDLSEVGASGRLNEEDKIGSYLEDNAGNVDSLLKLGGDAPSNSQLGIPGTMLEAYMNAANILAKSQPNCHLDWSLLASIGRIESNHARHGRLDDKGNTTPNILGPVLNGGGFAAIIDTDGGRWDGDNRWDRAVGAMQFIPSTWEAYASDGNHDGVTSPHNVFDATVAAGKFLCSGGMNLANDADRAAAVFRYNHSDSYVATVLLWANAYAHGASPMPDDYVPPTDLAVGPPSIGNNPPIATPSQPGQPGAGGGGAPGPGGIGSQPGQPGSSQTGGPPGSVILTQPSLPTPTNGASEPPGSTTTTPPPTTCTPPTDTTTTTPPQPTDSSAPGSDSAPDSTSTDPTTDPTSDPGTTC